MTIDELLIEIATRNIQLRKSGDGFILSGAENVLDTSLVNRMRAHKTTLWA